jgi:predicted DNA repair protein MutK
MHVTDFIHVEIVIIALGNMPDQPILENKYSRSTFIAILATVGAYGIVAVIVRMDDLGTSH